MFARGFETKPQLGDDARAIREGILADELIVSDGFDGFGSRGPCLRFGDNVLAHFVLAQLQPLPPSALWSGWPAFHKRNVFASHGMHFQLVDEMLTSSGV